MFIDIYTEFCDEKIKEFFQILNNLFSLNFINKVIETYSEFK